MRLEWIDDILAVLESGSLARAAEKRSLTQSAFTRRVRLIEDSIGAELLRRLGNLIHRDFATEIDRGNTVRRKHGKHHQQAQRMLFTGKRCQQQVPDHAAVGRGLSAADRARPGENDTYPRAYDRDHQ